MTKLLTKLATIVVWSTCNIAVGVFVSAMFFSNGDSHSEGHAVNTAETADLATEHKPAHDATHRPTRTLADADTLIYEDQIPEALEIYQHIAKGTHNDAALEYRLAMCHEALGKHDVALTRYQRTAALATEGATKIAARLGQARVFTAKRQFGVARSIYYDLIASPHRYDPLVAEAFHRLFEVLLAEGYSNQEGLASESGLATATNEMAATEILDLISQTQESNTSGSAPTITVLDRTKNDPEAMSLTVIQNNAGLAECISAVAGAVELEVQWQPAAQRVAKSKTTTVSLHGTSLAFVLDALLEPHGIVWSLEKENIQLRALDEATPDKLHAMRQDQARRVGKTAAALFPEHRLISNTWLGLGNIEMLSGQLDSAIGYYQEISRRSRESSDLRYAWFNLAKAYLRQNRIKESRESFFRSADHGRGTALESAAYLLLGRSDVEALEIDDATRNLVRAVSLSSDEDVRAQSALMLACVYMIDQNPPAANNVIMDHRASFTNDRYRNEAAFISALAGFLATSDEAEQERRGRILTNAIPQLQIDNKDALTLVALIGTAFTELGFPNQTIRVYEEGIKHGRPCPLRHRLSMDLANELMDSGDLSKAEDVLQAVILSDDEEWSRKARTRLADLAFKVDKIPDCLLICYELLRTSFDKGEKQDVLRLMGRAFEKQSDHYSAALCYAGLVPTEKKR